MNKINVIINGKEKYINASSSIYSILDEMKITSPLTVVEKNLEIIPKDQYNQAVKEGDILEIVGFFGGG